MTDSLDEPIHEYTTETQENGAAANKGQSDEEIVASSHLEPGCWRKRDVCCQKHQCKQRWNDDIENLAGSFCQALGRLCDESFSEFHGLKIDCKDKKIGLIPQIFFENFPDQTGFKTSLYGKSSQLAFFFELVFSLDSLGFGL